MIKRYDPSWHKPMEMDEETSGDWIEYADHAAFVAQVRGVAEGMPHSPRCQVMTYRTPFSAITRESDEAAGLTKCTCPRGKLLALCEETSNG